MARFTLYINFRECIIERPLPAENNRSIDMDFRDIASDCVIRFEVFDNVWTVFSNESVSMSCGGENTDEHILADGDVIKFRTNDNISFAVMVCRINKNITDFTKYSLKDQKCIAFGKNENQDIIVNSPYISSEHAVFLCDNEQWYIDDKSLNGTYINGAKINGRHMLVPGDIIYTVGLKIVFLGEIIAINRSDIVICRLSTAGNETEKEPISDANTEKTFSRSPRTVEPLFDEVIEIEAPPNPVHSKNQPLLFVVGPSVTMPIPILLSTFINNQTNPSSRSYLGILASVGMSAVIGVGWALAHYFYNNKSKKADEDFRIAAYQEYISKNEALIREKQNYNNSVLVTQYLSSEDIVNRFFRDNSFVWNRNRKHDDFLHIRLGTGNVEFGSNIAVPAQRFSLYKDSMAELPQALYEKYKYISNTVVTVDLMNNSIIGMIGNDAIMQDTLTNIMVQIAVLHCYTDVRMALFTSEKDYRTLKWAKWLPHFLSDDMKIRMIADERISYQNVLYHIDELLRQRVEKLEETNGDYVFSPHYIVLCTDSSIFDGDGIEKYMSISEKLGFTFILAYGKMDKLPNECKTIIQCDDDFTGYYSLESKRGETDRVNLDAVPAAEAEMLAKGISMLKVREFSTGEIPNYIDYFNMIGIGRLEQWDLEKKYKENRVYEGIRSFVGIGNGGKPVYIDIHEKKHGPHGLVAGTTGSGKSETLQTFIVSLALNYHPDEVAFILIDYKGGGMAFAFENMPHIAGMITNLGGENEDGEIDANLTRRALVSIRSEIKYRQSIFNKYKVNHIDAYIKLYRAGNASEPLPHLIIISDEFAELKKEQPEFIKELVSTARVGRSLGIHLILATQKPGGVVDDEIWSNSRFKLCLRVQDKQDSMGMLKRPDAAYLTQTGRAYLQIGNDEIFEQFQTGYSGTGYVPKDDITGASESDMYMMNIDGTQAVTPVSKKKKEKNNVSQLKAAVDYITAKCRDVGIRSARALWLPELAHFIFADDINADGYVQQDTVSAVIGCIDDPERQRQLPAVINISDCSNIIIAGMAGMGKTTLLQTIFVYIMKHYTPEQASFYILDFSSRTMKLFSNSAHCGLAALSDENEAVTRLFSFLNDKINERRALFNKETVGSYSEYIRHKPIPMLIVAIDNFYSFSELYPDLQESFLRMTRDCAKYGIQIIITCNNLNDIRYKLRQNFSNVFTLIMAEKGDYRDAWGMSPEFLPKNTKGRGLILSDGRLLEFQTALPAYGQSEFERNAAISEFIAENNKLYAAGTDAEKVKTLPVDQSYTDFCGQYQNKDFIPVGYRTEDISVYGMDLYNTFCYAVSCYDSSGITAVLSNFAEACSRADGYVYCVKLSRDIKIDVSGADKVCRSKDDVIEMLAELRGKFSARAVAKKECLSADPNADFAKYICSKHEKIFVIIDSMSEFLKMLYAPSQVDMHTITEEYFKNGFGMGIYFIAGFDAMTYGSAFSQPACTGFVSYRQGIHFGGRYDKQKLFTVAMSMTQAMKPDEISSGMISENGKDVKIHIPLNKKE